MPSSDSEDFESADEGHGTPDKKERKKRLSSSNYSDNALEDDKQPLNTKSSSVKDQKLAETDKMADGWDDFDIEDTETVETNVTEMKREPQVTCSQATKTVTQESKKTQDTGWDEFDDWGQDDAIGSSQKEEPHKNQPLAAPTSQTDRDIKGVTEKLAAASTGGGWGWGWSVDSLLSTATAGITTITSQVSQGISTVLETGIGAPNPEELARRTSDNESHAKKSEDSNEKREKIEAPVNKENADSTFPFGGLLSGVTKFVENTGTKVISGGLDTLETIGKKTMEVLQDGDPGLAKKRAMLGLGEEKPVLSQVLREAKDKAEEEDRTREEKREAKEVHYATLFDDFEGLVHLEALEMLSKQASMRIDERLRSAEPAKRQDIKETLQQVAELCEIPEEDEVEDEPPSEDLSKSEAFLERLHTATQDLGLKLQFQPLVKQYEETLNWLSTGDHNTKALYKRAVSSLAHSTALAVQLYHKAAEMLLVNTRRSTADEADALTQMTVVLTKFVNEQTTLFADKLNSMWTDENKDQISDYTTKIFLETNSSASYIEKAFQLTLPIVQIGAV